MLLIVKEIVKLKLKRLIKMEILGVLNLHSRRGGLMGILSFCWRLCIRRLERKRSRIRFSSVIIS